MDDSDLEMIEEIEIEEFLKILEGLDGENGT